MDLQPATHSPLQTDSNYLWPSFRRLQYSICIVKHALRICPASRTAVAELLRRMFIKFRVPLGLLAAGAKSRREMYAALVLHGASRVHVTVPVSVAGPRGKLLRSKLRPRRFISRESSLSDIARPRSNDAASIAAGHKLPDAAQEAAGPPG